MTLRLKSECAENSQKKRFLSSYSHFSLGILSLKNTRVSRSAHMGWPDHGGRPQNLVLENLK
jgi:hypothetical protein